MTNALLPTLIIAGLAAVFVAYGVGRSRLALAIAAAVFGAAVLLWAVGGGL